MATDLTDEELAIIEHAIHAHEGAEDRNPISDMLALIAEVRRTRPLLRELKIALDWMVAESGCDENGEYDTEAARSAEALLDRMDKM